MLNETLYSQVRGSMSTLKERSSNAPGGLTGLEETNYEIVGVSGEYLTLFLEDISSRSSGLLVQLDELIDVYEGFESFKVLSNNRQPLHPISPLILASLLSFSLLSNLEAYVQEDSLTLEKEQNWTCCISGGRNVFLMIYGGSKSWSEACYRQSHLSRCFLRFDP